jgi:hypothetical protein
MLLDSRLRVSIQLCNDLQLIRILFQNRKCTIEKNDAKDLIGCNKKTSENNSAGLLYC